jgi:pimeloyl-ACP methyl ester carboxylesterase
MFARLFPFVLLPGVCLLPAGLAHGQGNGSGEIGVVFVAPTAGDHRLLANNLEELVRHKGIPLRVVTVPWSSGFVARDIRDQANHHFQGWRLACEVMSYREARPGCRVYLVSHSAGGAVVLAACRWLPADSVDRILLVAPGVSPDYDLRRALEVSRLGIDLFFHRSDRILNWAGRKFGTTEGTPGPTAGEVGFVPLIASPQDQLLYQKLRQIPYRWEFTDSGHQGGHLGYARLAFLNRYVLPMLLFP